MKHNVGGGRWSFSARPSQKDAELSVSRARCTGLAEAVSVQLVPAAWCVTDTGREGRTRVCRSLAPLMLALRLQRGRVHLVSKALLLLSSLLSFSSQRFPWPDELHTQLFICFLSVIKEGFTYCSAGKSFWLRHELT